VGSTTVSVAAPPGYDSARESLAHRVRLSAVVDVTGDDREAFLQGQLTQEMRGLAPGETRDAAGLTPKGKLLFVVRAVGSSDRIRLVLPAVLRTPVFEHLRKYVLGSRVTIEDRSEELFRISLYGPAAARLHVPADVRLLPAEGEFSAELLAPIAMRGEVERLLEEAGSEEVSGETAEILRVEAGRPRFGTDMDSTNLPDEVGLAEAISTTKGCYVGQEVVARLRTYGRVNRRLVRFRFPGRPIEPGTPLRRPDEEKPGKIEAGRVTSSAVSPQSGAIGLGYAFRDVSDGDRLVSTVLADDTAVVSDLAPA
jgi:folate-binding protein YgfZ